MTGHGADQRDVARRTRLEVRNRGRIDERGPGAGGEGQIGVGDRGAIPHLPPPRWRGGRCGPVPPTTRGGLLVGTSRTVGVGDRLTRSPDPCECRVDAPHAGPRSAPRCRHGRTSWAVNTSAPLKSISSRASAPAMCSGLRGETWSLCASRIWKPRCAKPTRSRALCHHGRGRMPLSSQMSEMIRNKLRK